MKTHIHNQTLSNLPKNLLAVSVSGVLALSSAVSLAQQVDEKTFRARGAASAMLEEVMVTAQKKSAAENLQRVPLSITAFGEAQMDAAKVEQISDFRFYVPNAVLNPNGTVPNTSAFYIRGLGTNTSIPSDDPAIGVFIDGVVLGMINGANLDTFDLQSVEILRGPQGTLFGRNVTGGAVLLTTQRADFETSAAVRGTVGSDGQLDGAFKITGTLIENTLAGKLSVLYDSTDGYFDNKNGNPAPASIFGETVENNSRYGENESLLIRPSLRYTPSDALTVDLIAEINTSDGDSGVGAKGTKNIVNGPLPDPSDNSEVNLTHTGLNELDSSSVTIDANYESGMGVWTSITGWRETEQKTIVDIDGSGGDVFNFLINPKNNQLSQELRWAGIPFGRDDIDLTAGLYYFNQTVRYLEGRNIFGSINQGFGGEVEHSNWAAFGNTSWQPNESWVFQLGIRYTDEKKSTRQTVGTNNCDVITGACTFDFQDSNSWQNTGGNLGVQYFSSDETQWYATLSRGFRSGGYNLRNTNADVNPSYDEETVNAFEVGVKSDLTDTLRINVALFHNEYADLQRTVVLPDTSQVTQNAAGATVEGLELELHWLVTENFSVSATYGYMNGGYDELDAAVFSGLNESRELQGFSALDVSGFEINRFSEHQGSLIATLDQPLATGALLSYRLAAGYLDDAPLNDANTIYSDTTTTLDGSVTFLSSDGKWNASIWGKNMTDETLRVAAIFTSIVTQETIAPGPRYGVDIEYRF